MKILGAINYRLPCYTSAGFGNKTASMTLVKRYFRWGLLGIVFLLTALAPMLCVVVDNDGDGDPTTGTIVEFSIITCKEIRVATSMVQAHSSRISRMPRAAHSRNWLSEQLEAVRPAPVLLASSESFLTPLRC